MTATERFLKYIGVDTQADPESGVHPSSKGQLALAKLLADELISLGLSDAHVNGHGIVLATLPSNTDSHAPVIGLIAHIDTADGTSGKNIKPRIIRGYDGGDIKLNDAVTMKAARFESLSRYVGQDLIVTDGTTLLGGDDKAGIAEIMTMLEIFIGNPALKHGTVKVAFTPDEEIGQGTDLFDVAEFGADFAYTVDGGGLGELEYENFNAAGSTVTFTGVGIHPGSAKNKMVNAAAVAMEFNAMLPVCEVPEATADYEGFYHLTDMRGTVSQAQLSYIIRDHDKAKFEAKKHMLESAAAYLNEKYGKGTVLVKTKDSYFNMREKVLPHMHLIETAKKAMQQNGVTPHVHPIRGGTDGARLSYMGLPCPNLCTGGHSAHGIYEYIPVQSLGKMPEILRDIVCLYTQG